ncbi:MAG: DUF4831 family protein, partial [Bacteroidetes bacterium]|nr:DUF4831 family protein [Bacteroidota bacterium]
MTVEKMKTEINRVLKGILPNIAFLLFCFYAQSQIKAYRVTDGINLSDKKGIYYALPQTLLKVDITVEKKEYFAGPYADY